MLIDLHVHLAGSGCCQSGIILGKKFQRRPSFYFLKHEQKITAKQMLTDIDLLWIKRISDLVKESKKVTKAVALCLDAIYGEDGNPLQEFIQLYVPNEWGIYSANQYAESLLFGASVHPYRKDALDELEKCFKNNAFLLKWLPSVMGIEPDNKLCIPFYDALKHFKIPLLSHADSEHTFSEPVKGWLLNNHILKLKAALERGVVVIAAHGGTPTQIEYAHELALKYENFFLDTSGLFNPVRARSALTLFKKAGEGVLGERLLFATDWPVPSFPIFLVDKLGFSTYREVSQIKNPFLRDLSLKEYLGFDIQRFKKIRKGC